MKKLSVFLSILFFVVNSFASPSTSLSITPTASDGGIIEASDENTRNNAVTTWANAHDHNDIDQTANTLAIGDAAAGNKTITANNADASKPYLRYDDTNDVWVISQDGSNAKTIVTKSGAASANVTLPQSPSQGDVLYNSGSEWVSLAAGTSGTALTTGGASANPAWAGMTTQGDIEYHNGTTRTRLAAGTSGYFLKTQGAGANPVWASSTASFYYLQGTRAMDAATGDVSYTGVGFQPSALIALAVVSTVVGYSNVGVTTAADTGAAMSDYHNQTASSWMAATNGTFIRLNENSTTNQSCVLKTFDADGFTLTWTRAGTTSAGTATLMILCIK